ncbi:MAG: hypothetical protein WDN67_04555 [Candidatus Moraniibacteriota bacterium]
MQNNLDSLIKYIAEKHAFTGEKYPEIKEASPEEILHFAIRHSALHFAKTAGKIAATSEDIDHGEKGKLEDLKVNTAKSLINTLRLAELLGMTEKELTERVTEILDQNNE